MPMNSGKDHKARKVEVTQPLMGAGTVGGNQGGDVLLQPVVYQDSEFGVAGYPTAGSLRAGRIPEHQMLLEPVGVTIHGTDKTVSVMSYSDISGSLRTKPPGSIENSSTTAVLQPIAFSCKDYGADATEDLSPTMRAMGHADSHANAGGQLAVCVTGSVTHTLRAEGFDASEDGTGRGQPIVCFTDMRGDMRGSGIQVTGEIANTLHCAKGQSEQQIVAGVSMAVRRLMPVECHRLQGFPDDWCAVPVRGKIAADGPQYKQLGNSWAVNHARWVGYRIAGWLAANPPQIIDIVFDPTMLLWAAAET